MLFLGAGASKEFCLPLFSKMINDFISEKRNIKYIDIISQITKELKRVGFRNNIENYISYAKGQSKPKETLLTMNPFVSYFVYNSKTKKLGYRPFARFLVDDLEEYIYDNLFVYQQDKKRQITKHYDKFFNFLNERYLKKEKISDFEIDIFTTNYDNVIEEYSELSGYTVFDGYAEKPDGISYFAPEFYRQKTHQIRLYKLQGSVRLGVIQNTSTHETAMVHTKSKIGIGEYYKKNWKIIDRIMLLGYDKDITRDPYFELLKLLKEQLNNNNIDVCIVVGYSFGDKPILNIFQDILRHREDSFQLIILDKKAKRIKKEKFHDDERIYDVNHSFSDFDKIKVS